MVQRLLVNRRRGYAWAIIVFSLLCASVAWGAPGDKLNHNSANTGSAYWSGNWGVTGGKYGPITCSTCHNRTTSNIKMVTSTIPTFMGISTTTPKPVVFKNVTAFGNDGDAHTTSKRICEVCHTQTKYHRYNTTGQTDLNHMNANNNDCTACHAHDTAFAASCGSCHGYPPDSTVVGAGGLATPATGAITYSGQKGSHVSHTNQATFKMKCEACHAGYTMNPMGNSKVEMGFAVNATNYPGFAGTVPVTTGTFTGNATLQNGYQWYTTSQHGTTINRVANTTTCSIYCHGSTLTGGTASTPSWVGTSQAACGACHGASSATPPTTANHTRHAGNGATSLALSCDKCHGAHADNTHVNGTVKWDLAGISAGAQYKTPTGSYATTGNTGALAPSASYGQCNNLYCHSNVQGAAGTGSPTTYAQPTWGASSLACDSCHWGDKASFKTMSTGSHRRHVATYSYQCSACHNAAGHDTTKHADGTIDVAFSAGGTYSQAGAPGNGYGTCSSTSCHTGAASAPTWGGSLPTDCTGCHGNETNASTKLSGAHNSHLNSVATGGSFLCNTCHATVITNANNRTIANNTLHANSMINYSGAMSGKYTGVSPVTCSTQYCHTNGKGGAPVTALPAWTSGANLNCNGCHGSTGNTSGMPTPDAVGVNSHTKHVPTQDVTKCVLCHRTTVNGSNAIITGSTHLNKVRDVRFSKPSAFTNNSGAYTLAARTCSATYCHGSAASDAWGTAGPLACNKCHDASNALPGAHVIHYNTATVNSGTYGSAPGTSSQSATAYQFACSACHGTDTTAHADFPKTAVSDATIFFSVTSAGRGANANTAYTRQATGSTDAKGFKWTTGGNGNCTATYCHSNGRGSNGGSTTVNWGLTARDASCSTCHGNATTTIAGTNPSTTPTMLSGAHKSHIGNAAAGGAFSCTECHASTLSSDTTIAANSYNKHVNKFVDYSGTYAGKTKSCSTFYCHSNGKGGAPVTAVPAWTSGTTLNCNGCHGSAGNTSGMPTPDAVGVNSHTKHLPTQDTAKCVFCHRTTVNNTSAIITASTHINAARDVRFSKPSTFTNNSGAYTTAARTCSATYCHGSAASDAWGTAGPLACNKCHDASNALPGAHVIHYNTATVNTGAYGAASGTSSQSATAYQFACSACHGTDTNAHADFPKTAVSDATIFFSVTSAGRGANANTAYTRQATGSTDSKGFKWTTGGNGNCTATYCHSNGRGSNGGSTTVNWGLTARDASCSTCHGNAATTTAGTDPTTTPNMLSGKHKSHIGNASAGGGFGCVDCHASTLSSDTAIAANSFNKHVNKFVDYSGSYAGKNRSCSTFTCHSNGRGGAPLVPVAGTWNGATTLDCSGCHGSTSANLVTGNHVAHLNKGAVCSNCHWNTTQAANSIAAVPQHINNSIGVVQGGSFGTTPVTVSFAGSTNCSNISCHSMGKFTNPTATWGGTLKCDGCHPTLSAAHTVHAGVLNLNTGVTFYSYTSVKSAGAESVIGVKYGFGCGSCHPLTASSHINGTIDIDLNPAAIGAGNLRKLNGAGAVYNADKSCDLVYCHSDGKNAMVVSGNGKAPVWTTTFAALGGDRCAKCHGNSPQTAAHNAHQVGIHYDNIFNGTSGKLAAAASGASAHGVAGQSTTITCNVCHNKTITTSANDQNALCNTCHTKGVNGALVKGNAAIAEFAFHVNGKKDVAFPATALKVVSKAQVRTVSFNSYSGVWVRSGSYKGGSTAFDTAKVALNDTMFSAATGNCSNISCHNLRVGQTVNWSQSLSCVDCHSDL